MPVRLLVGPSGSGKTTRALDAFKRFSPSEHMSSARLIVPTVSDVLQIRRLMLSDPEFPGVLGDPISTFASFASDLLPSPPKLTSDAYRRLILEESMRATPGCFERIRDYPSFPDELGRAIGALKTACIRLEELRIAIESAEARLPEGSRRKLLDLAAVYEAYEHTLAKSGASDPEDVMRRALDLSREKPDSLAKLRCVTLDGFHAFTPTQREFIRLFAEHCGEVIITLDYEEGRPDAFSSIEPTFRFLAELPGAVVDRMSPPDEGMLGHAKQSLFNADPPKSEDTEGVAILVGATPAMEVELVAGEIKKLVRENGFRFSEIGVIARSLRPHQRLIASTFEEYRIPVAPHIRPLSESALAQTVLNRLHDDLASSSTADPRHAVEALMRDVPLPDTEHRLQEHFAAWRSIARIMDGIVPAQGIVSVGDFARLLDIGIRTGIYRTPGDTEDGVTIESVGALRGRKFRAAFIIGLEDGAFPRRGREDPFINDWERAILNDHLPNPLPLRADDANERYLFHTALSSARERLYLSYSCFDTSGRRSRPSAYLDDVGALFAREIPRITREPRDVVPRLDRVETAKELTARTILDCCTAEDDHSQHSAIMAYNLLLERGSLGPSDFEWLSEGETVRIPPDIASLLALDREE